MGRLKESIIGRLLLAGLRLIRNGHATAANGDDTHQRFDQMRHFGNLRTSIAKHAHCEITDDEHRPKTWSINQGARNGAGGAVPESSTHCEI